MRRLISRRRFLKQTVTSAAAFGFMGCGHSLLKTNAAPRLTRDGKLRIACVGVGGTGEIDVDGVAGERLVAFCDVDDARAAGTFKKYPEVPRFKDYREMFAELSDQIDAVVVSTPDHMHYPIAKLAIEQGKHVYVQKPLAHTVWEVRELTRLAREHGVVTQMGNQGRASEGIRRIYEYLRSGVLGDIREVHLQTNRPIWPQGESRPADRVSVPTALDWNLWLGVAPQRSYHPDYVPFKWRGRWDFGTGALGDMACHLMDATAFALEPGAPLSIAAKSVGGTAESAPKRSWLHFRFAERKVKFLENGQWTDRLVPPLSVFWYDGGEAGPKFPAALADYPKHNSSYQLFVGEKGYLAANEYNKHIRIAFREKTAAPRVPRVLERVPKGNPYLEWISACKGGPKPGSNFDYAGPLTELALLGNIAIRVGGELLWDPQAMKFTNSTAGNELLSKTYRRF